MLQATNRLAETEPLYRRALAIFAISVGQEHPNTITARENFRQLLKAMRLAEADIAAKLRDAD